jgi:hypothetical protein
MIAAVDRRMIDCTAFEPPCAAKWRPGDPAGRVPGAVVSAARILRALRTGRPLAVNDPNAAVLPRIPCPTPQRG